jgi:hypothetical protein
VKSRRVRRARSPATSIVAILATLLGAGLLSEQNRAYADSGAPADGIVSRPASGTPAGASQQLSGSSTVVVRGTRPPIPNSAARPPAPAQAEARPIYRNPAFERDPYGFGLDTDFNFEGLSFNPPQ